MKASGIEIEIEGNIRDEAVVEESFSSELLLTSDFAGGHNAHFDLTI